MNAIPKKLQNYKRIQMPDKMSFSRIEPVNRVESLDARRAAKLAAIRRQELVIQSERLAQGYKDKRGKKQKELDYSMAYKHAKVPSPNMNQRNRNTGTQARKSALQNNMQMQSQKQSGTNYKVRNVDAQRNLGVAHVQKKKVKQQPVPKTNRLQVPEYVQNRQGGSRYRMQSSGVAAIRQEQRPLIPGFDMYAENTRVAYKQQVEAERRVPRRKEMVTTILCIALIFAMLVFVLLKYAELSNVTHQNSQIENNIVEMEQQLEKLDMDISLKESVSSVQQRAIELGMAYPTADQIVYITADSGDADAVGISESTDGTQEVVGNVTV